MLPDTLVDDDCIVPMLPVEYFDCDDDADLLPVMTDEDALMQFSIAPAL